MLTIALLCLIPLLAPAAELSAPAPIFSRGDKFEITYQVAHAADCVQTLNIARHPDRWEERGSAWLLGKHPAPATVAAWCVMSAYGHAQMSKRIAHWFPDHPVVTRVWQSVTIGATLATVQHNYELGLQFSF
jgi:hypothetical protein